MRIILSRKGYDTGAGKGASPILPDGRMVSMPIPEPHPAPAGPTFESAMVPGQETITYAELGVRCGLRTATGPAHVDPDLVPGARPRAEGWRAALGQAGIAAGHLRNQGVGPGDLFVFFGLFAPLGDRELRRERSFHAVFGYLQVDRVVDVGAGDTGPGWLADHPHLSAESRAAFSPNRVYIARPTLSFAEDRPGWGIFRYHERLRLTPLDHHGLTCWEFPICFGPDAGGTVSYLPAPLWTLAGHGAVRVEVRGNKQELVCRGGPGIEAWAQQIVRDSDRWAP